MSTMTVDPQVSRVPDNFPRSTPSYISKRRVLSVCPQALEKTIPLGMSFYTFRIPGVARDHYHILEVEDSFTLIPSGHDDLSETNPTPELRPAPQSAQGLASSLVAEWQRNPSGAGPMGVAMMPVDMEVGSPGFEALLRTLNANQFAVANWAIRDANDKVQEGKAKQITDEFHRKMAEWLYGEDGARALPWYNSKVLPDVKSCAACSKMIKAAAKVCEHCQTNLVDWFIKYNQDPSTDPIIAAFVTGIKAPSGQTEGKTFTADTPKAPRPAPQATITDDVWKLAKPCFTAEHQAYFRKLALQTEKDTYLLSILPDLCLKYVGLHSKLAAVGCVVPEE